MQGRVHVDARTVHIEAVDGMRRTVTFPSEIAQVLELRHGVALRLRTDPYSLPDRNVYGVQEDLQTVWRLDASFAGAVCTELVDLGDRLRCLLAGGGTVEIDPSTGRPASTSGIWAQPGRQD